MEKNKFENQFLENFVDVAAELLAYNNQSTNSPTPSLNNFSKIDLKEDKIVINEQEAEEILSILKDLQKELEKRDGKIEQLETKVKSENEKTELKSSIEHKEKEKKFKTELVEHSQNLDLVTVLVQSGSECCELTGNLFRVYNDFIILLDGDNDLIKVKINKIVAIKVINNKEEQSFGSQNINQTEENSAEANEEESEEKNLAAV